MRPQSAVKIGFCRQKDSIERTINNPKLSIGNGLIKMERDLQVRDDKDQIFKAEFNLGERQMGKSGKKNGEIVRFR